MGLVEYARGLFTKAPPKTRGRVVQDQAIWDQFRRIGGSLTPQQVSAIMRNADAGRMEDLVDLANDARQKDLTLQCVLATRELAVQGLPWELFYPGQDRKSTRGKRQLEFLKETLANAAWLPSLIGHLTGGNYYGHAVGELDYERDGRYLVPTARNLSPRRFGYRDTDGAFVWRDQQTNWQDVEFQRLYPYRFIVSQPRINGDVPCREGLVRPLMWAALFRNWALADWLKLAEIAWKPWRRGIYKKTASQKDIDDLVSILSGMSGSGVAVHPETTEVFLEWAKANAGTQAGHNELIEMLGREMAKGVLGQTLTTAEGKNGARSLGEVHNEVRKDIREADARHIACVLTYGLIQPLIRLNFGDADVPHWRFLTEESADIKLFSEGLSNLVAPAKGVGLKVPAAWARDRLGIPEPVGDEECLGVEVEVDVSEHDEDAEKPPKKDEDEDDGGAE